MLSQKHLFYPRIPLLVAPATAGGEAAGEIPAAQRRKGRLQRHRGPSATAAVGPLGRKKNTGISRGPPVELLRIAWLIYG